MALVINDGPSDVAAAVSTTNRGKANPVLWSEQVLANRRVRGVVLNSGGMAKGAWICRDGGPEENRDKVDLFDRVVMIRVDLKAGPATATIWTNDLTHTYLHENSAYST